MHFPRPPTVARQLKTPRKYNYTQNICNGKDKCNEAAVIGLNEENKCILLQDFKLTFPGWDKYDILPVQDNLQRALENDDMKKEGVSFDTFTKGIVMTLKEFSSVLSKYGLSEINPINSPFDSNFHQAIFEEERSDVPVGTVIKVLQKSL